MATVTCFVPSNMESTTRIYGEITEATSTTITWESGDFTTVYKGNFYYDAYGNVYGTVSSVTSYANGEKTGSITNINRDVSDAFYYGSFSDPEYLYSYLFSGQDTFKGSSGIDKLYAYDGNDKMYGNEGNDKLVGGAGNDLLRGGNGSDNVRGDEGNDQAFGEAGNDRVYGDDGNDILKGGEGRDSLFGEDGSDRLFGEAGSDVLFGGANADQFMFLTAQDSGTGGAADVISDFNNREDRINVSQIDADTTRSGNQAFDYIGSAAFSGTAGEIRFQNGLISADVNGDRKADFQIKVSNVSVLETNDFVL